MTLLPSLFFCTLSLASWAALSLMSFIKTFFMPLTSVAKRIPLMPQPVKGSQTEISRFAIFW